MIEDIIARARGQLEHNRPVYRITLGDRDITDNFAGRLRRLTITDNRGLEADQVDIELDDSDGRLNIPGHGEFLNIAIGWEGEPLVNKGSFIIDETEHSGAIDTLCLRGRGADISEGLLKKQDRSFHDTTIQRIIGEMAAEHGLLAVVDAALAEITVPHIDQTAESAVNLLTRLGIAHDAVATVKSHLGQSYMIFMPVGNGRSVSGHELGHIELTRRDGDRHRYLRADRQGDSFTGVQANYYDLYRGSQNKVVAGSEERPRELRHVYPNRETALRAANSEWKRRQRQSATLTYTLAYGRPNLLPEMTFQLQGVKGDLDGIRWLCRKVEHRINDGGFTTSLDLEKAEIS